jgi:predicted HAD superfamily Cof-like phosphohydrolase
MTEEQKRVSEFMKMFGQNVPERPTQLDEETAQLRAALILEEAFETIVNGLGLKIAIPANSWDWWEVDEKNLSEQEFYFTKEKEVDLVELADGLADLAYVSSHGTACAAGIDLEPIEKAVDESNKSKLWKREDLDKVPPNCKVEDVGNDVYRVKRSDGKIIKSPSYRPANLEPIIEEQKNRSEISSNTLETLERSIAEFKKGNVGSPILPNG